MFLCIHTRRVYTNVNRLRKGFSQTLFPCPSLRCCYHYTPREYKRWSPSRLFKRPGTREHDAGETRWSVVQDGPPYILVILSIPKWLTRTSTAVHYARVMPKRICLFTSVLNTGLYQTFFFLKYNIWFLTPGFYIMLYGKYYLVFNRIPLERVHVSEQMINSTRHSLFRKSLMFTKIFFFYFA